MIVAINMLNIVYHRLKALYPPSVVIPWIQIYGGNRLRHEFMFETKNRKSIWDFVVEKRQVEGFSYHSCNPVSIPICILYQQSMGIYLEPQPSALSLHAWATNPSAFFLYTETTTMYTFIWVHQVDLWKEEKPH